MSISISRQEALEPRQPYESQKDEEERLYNYRTELEDERRRSGLTAAEEEDVAEIIRRLDEMGAPTWEEMQVKIIEAIQRYGWAERI